MKVLSVAEKRQKDNQIINMLTIAQERIGQYANRNRASKAAKRLIRSTGARHRIQLTIAYRDLIPTVCWTVVLGIPGPGDKFQG